VSAPVLSPAATFLIEYLDLPSAASDDDATWQAFQIAHFNNPSLFAIALKSRQCGWSWTCAAEAVANGALIPRHLSIFVSINQDESKEKIRYAKQIIEALDDEAKPRLLHDNETYLEFENGSRIISHPCRPVRGKAKATIYLDEFAHYPKDREIYLSALPAATRGGIVRVGSSPLGASGMFWEIYEQKIKAYPGYKRSYIPWWSVAALCKDVQAAIQSAPDLETEARVRNFGAPRLVEIFENMVLEDFQQEYECAWLDESLAWISWDEIKRNQVQAQEEKLWYRQARTVDGALRVIDEVAEQCQRGAIESALAGGFDVGRHHDLSELTFIGKSTTNQLPYRLGISLRGVEYDDQQSVAQKALRVLPITQMLIDQNGIGNQLAEDLHKEFGERAQGVDFTNPNKELWAVEIKLQMQRGQVPIPLERDLAYQIHSIKKRVSSAKNNVFDAERTNQGHADKFWALALAVWAAKSDNIPLGFVMSYR
jgi:phage FluMu gp28-like protein